MPTEQGRWIALDPIISVNRGVDLWDIDPRITRVWSAGGRNGGGSEAAEPCGRPIYYGVEERAAATGDSAGNRVKRIIFFDDPAEAYANLERS